MSNTDKSQHKTNSCYVMKFLLQCVGVSLLQHFFWELDSQQCPCWENPQEERTKTETCFRWFIKLLLNQIQEPEKNIRVMCHTSAITFNTIFGMLTSFMNFPFH